MADRITQGQTGSPGGFSIKFTVDGKENVSSLSLAFQGRLEEVIDQKREELGEAYVAAMGDLAARYKPKLRGPIQASGFYKANSLAKTWRVTPYPRGGDSLEPALFIATKAADILEAHELGSTVTVHNAKYLAIPQGAARAVVRTFNRAVARSPKDSGIGKDANGHFTSLGGMTDRVAAYLGVTLVPIINRQTGKGVLVASNSLRLTKTGRAAKNQNGQPTVLFVLTKIAQLKKVPMGLEVLAAIQGSFSGDFAAALAARLPADSK